MASAQNQPQPQPQPQPAWQLAVHQHLASLPENQRIAYRAPADAETCLNVIIKAQSRRRGFTRLMELMRPLIEPLKRFEGAIDVLVQTHGGVASPIWGPIRLAVNMASEHFKALESLAMILHKFVGCLERFTNYDRLFKSSAAVQKAIGTLYADLIDFCTRVARFYSRSSMLAMMSSFDKEFLAMSQLIDLHSADVDWVANAANIQESQEARKAEDAARKGEMIWSHIKMCAFASSAR